MPTNRLVAKEEVATYAGFLLNAANDAGGQDAVIEVRDQMDKILRIMNSDMDLSMAFADASYTPEPVSYTHLDVYKRQGHPTGGARGSH